MSDDRALVSVVVPTRNSARTLEACLISLCAQSYSPIELIVVDNGSADETLGIASRHADVVESYGPERSAQRNRGAEVAHGDYLLFIDSDMTLSQGVVGDCVEAVRLAGAPAVVIPEISVGEGFLARCRALERSCYAGDNNIEAARFFTREAFDSAGGFDENLTGPEDWDLSIRVAGGSSLPRTASQISHDEGRLRLAAVLQKKRYYAASSVSYWRKHGRSTFSQANLVFRPAFLRSWRRLLRHPVLTVGFLTLKSLEAAAALSGIVEVRAHSKTRRATDPSSP
ncbi:MAG TPA: glycosyltransferase [Candidatus Dormibacteraeota bacterium]|nr:glycosyltransferase [Candidatus Dormibacteraeota bacterium]